MGQWEWDMPTCWDVFSLELQTLEDPVGETGHILFLTITLTLSLLVL